MKFIHRPEYLSDSNLGNKIGYYKGSLAETTMVQIKKLLKRTLSLRDQTTQISEIYAIIKTLNKLTELGMPNTKVIA